MTQATRVAIIGATGYSGIELVRLLQSHPQVQLTYLSSESYTGQAISEVYPHLAGRIGHALDGLDPAAVAARADVVFLGLPAGKSSELVPAFLAAGLRVIDMGGDFRLVDGAVHEQWYKKPAPPRHVQAEAVYGLSELWRDAVRQARFITNPGCYATSAILGLAPLLRHGLIDPASVIIDAKSGVSGAGRGVTLGVHFAEVNENFQAYKVNQHQHTPEIEQVLGQVAAQPLTVTFTTHLLPITRGILCTSYATLKAPVTAEALRTLYTGDYAGCPFVRTMPLGSFPATKQVQGSNYCDIGLAVDERTHRVTVISVIDNLVKGAAGQAIQNFNLMMGYGEGVGLDVSPLYP
ncbi:MAG: N-acetyl-gamma-glutamyl-phosphate reductase [Candidatus Sericytochromatia bacterium]|nr:N-acetyl-gamma-glutamyl-phosphate reductase [Candidatus Sericytochromatia bacterium]